MDCERIEELLSLYLENDLGPDDRESVAAHLSTCRSCASLYTSLEQVQTSLSRFPEAAPSAALLDRLYSIPVRSKRRRHAFDFFLRPQLQPLLAAASILMMAVSLFMFHPDRRSIEKSIDRQFHLGYSKVERIYSRAESFANSLDKHKDDLLVSLQNLGIFPENEKKSTQTTT